MEKDDEMTDDERSRARFAELARLARRSQRLGVGIVIAVAVLVAVVSSVASAWNTRELRRLTNDTRELLRNELPVAAALEVEKKLKDREREFGVASVRCLLEQLGEHRRQTARAHQATATAHGYSFSVPLSEAPPPGSTADTVCASFLNEAEGK